MRSDETQAIDPLVAFILFFVLAMIVVSLVSGSGGRRAHRTRRGNWITVGTGGGWGGGWSGGSGWSGGGGFSGGGGSSGGGGASGSW